MRILRLLIEYDGSDFVGWQIQAQGRTIQGELARALRVLLQEDICPTGSGRTDAGTHALAQVAHFHTQSGLPTERILRGLNGLLPRDIAVHQVEQVPADFHARYSAKRKRYRYRIHQGKSAINRLYTWVYDHPIDMESMRQSSLVLNGIHRFGAFCKQDPVPDDLHCTIYAAEWRREGRELIFEIEGNRFLRHMVRILVGTMFEIGLGKRPPNNLATLLQSGRRTEAGRTAPSRGLHLLWVRYES